MEEHVNEQFNEIKKKKKRKFVDMNLPGYTMGVKVPGRSTGELEMALRKFKKMVSDAGIMEEYRNRQEYLKPSVIKRRQRLQAIRRKNSDYDDFE